MQILEKIGDVPNILKAAHAFEKGLTNRESFYHEGQRTDRNHDMLINQKGGRDGNSTGFL